MVKTLNSRRSSAEICRRNGWRAGTRLRGNEGGESTTIIITAVGQWEILAKEEEQEDYGEHIWWLDCREWEEVRTPEAGGAAVRPADEEVARELSDI